MCGCSRTHRLIAIDPVPVLVPVLVLVVAAVAAVAKRSRRARTLLQAAARAVVQLARRCRRGSTRRNGLPVLVTQHIDVVPSMYFGMDSWCAPTVREYVCVCSVRTVQQKPPWVVALAVRRKWDVDTNTAVAHTAVAHTHGLPIDILQ